VTYSTTSRTEWRHLSTCVRQSLCNFLDPVVTVSLRPRCFRERSFWNTLSTLYFCRVARNWVAVRECWCWWSCGWCELRLWTTATNGPNVSTDKLGGMMSTEETYNSSTRVLWQTNLPAETSGSKRWEMGERNENLACEVFLFILASDFLHAVKYYDMFPPDLLSLRSKVCCWFLSLFKIRLFRVWTYEPWVWWQSH
jgi:hypothetical protein